MPLSVQLETPTAGKYEQPTGLYVEINPYLLRTMKLTYE